MLNDVSNNEFASEEELRQAIEHEASNPSPRIAAGAIWILRRNPRLKEYLTPLQLISMAYEAILAERNWRKNVTFSVYVVNVMRSLAYNDNRKLKNTRPQIVYGQEAYDNQILEEDELESAEEMMIQRQTAELRILKLKSVLHKDKTALEILTMLLEHGLSKAEIRSKLGLSDTKFWSADRKIQRAIEKLGDE